MNIKPLSSVVAFLAFSILGPAQTAPPPGTIPSKSNAPGMPGLPVRPLGQQSSAATPPPTQDQLAARSPVRALHVQSMKMLTPSSGWVSTGTQLLMTTDSGSSWKDISPPNPDTDAFASIFFLDPFNGWILLAHSDNDEDWTFSIASTNDGGADWSSTKLPAWTNNKAKGERGLVDQGVIAFADRDRGWVSLGIEGNTLFSSSTLLVTSNGGRTWEWTKDEPEGRTDGLLGVTDSDLWVTGHPAGASQLSVTHDGGRNFEVVSMAPPRKSLPIICLSMTCRFLLIAPRATRS